MAVKNARGLAVPSGRKMSCFLSCSSEFWRKSTKRSSTVRICSPSCTWPTCTPPSMALWAGETLPWLAPMPTSGTPPVRALSWVWKSVGVSLNWASLAKSGRKMMPGPATTSPSSTSATPGVFSSTCPAWRASFSRVAWLSPKILISMGLGVLIRSPKRSAMRWPKSMVSAGWVALMRWRSWLMTCGVVSLWSTLSWME